MDGAEYSINAVIEAASARGEEYKAEALNGNEMLSSDDFAHLFGVSRARSMCGGSLERSSVFPALRGGSGSRSGRSSMDSVFRCWG